MAETRDPIDTDPDKYSVVFENDRVRVLEYRDTPGARTPHGTSRQRDAPLSAFERRSRSTTGCATSPWSAARCAGSTPRASTGENIGATDTHVVFVELKEPGAGVQRPGELGPSEPASPGAD